MTLKINLNQSAVKPLSQERVQELLIYNPATGSLAWKLSPGNRIKPGQKAGCVKSNGYRVVAIDKRIYYSSKLIWLYMTGEWPSMTIDHIDRNRSNEKWNNLRHISRAHNATNKSLYANNRTGVNGISRDKKSGQFDSRLTLDGKTIYLGRYPTVHGAAFARARAELDLYP